MLKKLQIRNNTFGPEVTSTGTYTNKKYLIGSSGRL